MINFRLELLARKKYGGDTVADMGICSGQMQHMV